MVFPVIILTLCACCSFGTVFAPFSHPPRLGLQADSVDSVQLLLLAEQCHFPNISDTVFIRTLSDALVVKLFNRFACSGCLAEIASLLKPSVAISSTHDSPTTSVDRIARSQSTQSIRSSLRSPAKSSRSFLDKNGPLKSSQSVSVPTRVELADHLLQVLTKDVASHSDKDNYLSLIGQAIVFNHFELVLFLDKIPLLKVDDGPSGFVNRKLFNSFKAFKNRLYQLRFDEANRDLIEKFICPNNSTRPGAKYDDYVPLAVYQDNYTCFKYVVTYSPLLPEVIDSPPRVGKTAAKTGEKNQKATNKKSNGLLKPTTAKRTLLFPRASSRRRSFGPISSKSLSARSTANTAMMEALRAQNAATTPVHSPDPYLESAKQGNLELFSFLTSTARPDYFERDARPLFIAAQNGDLSFLKYIVKMGSDICAQDGVAVHEALKNHQLEAVKFLAFRGIFKCHATTSPTYLLIAYASTATVEVVHFLLACEANLHAMGDRPLLNSIKGNNWDVVTYLIEMGANPCVADALPLRLAASKANADILKLMVQKGATMCATTSEKVMYNALLHDNEEVSRWVVEEGYVDPTRFLKQSIAKGDWGYTKYLVSKGADACVVKCKQFKSCNFKMRMFLKYKCWTGRFDSMWRKVTGQRAKARTANVDIEREQKYHERVRELEKVGRTYKEHVARSQMAGPNF